MGSDTCCVLVLFCLQLIITLTILEIQNFLKCPQTRNERRNCKIHLQLSFYDLRVLKPYIFDLVDLVLY